MSVTRVKHTASQQHKQELVEHKGNALDRERRGSCFLGKYICKVSEAAAVNSARITPSAMKIKAEPFPSDKEKFYRKPYLLDT